jgi:hypothetical protein
LTATRPAFERARVSSGSRSELEQAHINDIASPIASAARLFVGLSTRSYRHPCGVIEAIVRLAQREVADAQRDPPLRPVHGAREGAAPVVHLCEGIQWRLCGRSHAPPGARGPGRDATRKSEPVRIESGNDPRRRPSIEPIARPAPRESIGWPLLSPRCSSRRRRVETGQEAAPAAQQGRTNGCREQPAPPHPTTRLPVGGIGTGQLHDRRRAPRKPVQGKVAGVEMTGHDSPVTDQGGILGPVHGPVHEPVHAHDSWMIARGTQRGNPALSRATLAPNRCYEAVSIAPITTPQPITSPYQTSNLVPGV